MTEMSANPLRMVNEDVPSLFVGKAGFMWSTANQAKFILWKSGRQELDLMNAALLYIFEMYYRVDQVNEDYS